MSEDTARLLRGRVSSGVGNASHWLSRFNDAYSRKLGFPVYPGSLNLTLAHPFDWSDPQLQRSIVRLGREEYGGERDILLVPCRLRSLNDTPAFLWTTTNAAREREDAHVIEIVAPLGLRSTFALRDGDEVEVALPLLGDAVHP